jgi:hypothetical protein
LLSDRCGSTIGWMEEATIETLMALRKGLTA